MAAGDVAKEKRPAGLWKLQRNNATMFLGIYYIILSRIIVESLRDVTDKHISNLSITISTEVR